jgi:MOSC domain-containing protein YiiM
MDQELGEDLKALMHRFPRAGRLEWIGLRLRCRAALDAVDRADAIHDRGLMGDHSASRSGGKRQVTLIQSEHLVAVAQLIGQETLDPARLRRNLVVSGINLLALRDREFCIGEVVLLGTGPCAPCSRMEEALGVGGFNAMRGHGGITAKIIHEGALRVGDSVSA